MSSSSVTQSPEPISVIICTYTPQRWDRLNLAIASVHAQTYHAQEIIIVVDHHQELFAQAQRELQKVRVIPNTGKPGLANARNSGISVACGTLFAFLDDDAIAEPGWLCQISTALRDPTVLGVGSTVVPIWEDQEPPWFPAEFYWVVGCSYQGLPHTTVPIRNPIGASMCIRKEIFQTVGGFHSAIGRIGTLPIGCEETELSIRTRQHWPDRYFLYLHHTQVLHHVPKKRATWRYFCSRCYAEGISKATLARIIGTKDTLSSEYAYTLQVLPIGILRNLILAISKRRFSYVLRALAIILGLCLTITGYLVKKYASRTPKK